MSKKAAPPSAALTAELLSLVQSSDEGLTDERVRLTFGPRYEQLAPSINELLSNNRLQLFTQGGALVYKAVKEETAIKFEGLGTEEMLVYQVIERSGNRGIWTRDIKTASNVTQHNLTKILKILEQRCLIKSVRSVVSKSKKLYMIYEATPAKEITGGPWYSEHEFDHEFVAALSNFIVQTVKSQKMMDLTSISDKVRISGISTVELSPQEIELIVNTLVYDGRLETVQSSVLLYTGYAATKKMFKVGKSMNPPDFLTEVPCGVCPIISQCSEGGVISPTSCRYLTHWLEMQPEDMYVDKDSSLWSW
mmetsp:Transcript_3882/g.5337  ORF Transcript_3882/g.5337 Transcript_3882/m.5337 type:complete len:307 (+) Transcript_3882:18-938(+)